MKINRSNYESYFIDYIDGTLPDDLVDELLDFLQENPDLAEELNAAKDISLKPQSSTFDFKERLYKNSNDGAESFEMQAVAYLESDLNEANKEQFLAEIADDSAKLKTLHLLQHAKLSPDFAIKYPDKKELLRRSNKTFYLWATRVAALLLIFFSVWAIVPRKKQVLPDNPIAEQQVISHPELNSETGENIASNATREPIVEKNIEVANSSENEPAIVELKKRITTQVVANETKEPEVLAMRSAVPDQIEPLKAEIKPTAVEVGKLHLPSPTNKLTPKQPTVTVDEYLAHKIINAPKGESFTFNNIANAGLNAVENLSNERFNVERTENGKLKEIKFDSRLIAFSIPFRKNH